MIATPYQWTGKFGCFNLPSTVKYHKNNKKRTYFVYRNQVVLNFRNIWAFPFHYHHLLSGNLYCHVWRRHRNEFWTSVNRNNVHVFICIVMHCDKNLTFGKEVSENRRNISKNVPHKTFLLSIDIGRLQIKVLTTIGNILIAYFLVVYYLIQNIQ